jgi:hypothetical protein
MGALDAEKFLAAKEHAEVHEPIAALNFEPQTSNFKPSK